MTRTLVALMLIPPLLGCQSTPVALGDLGRSGELTEFVADRRVAAERSESQGALRDALREWQLIDAVSPDDTHVRSEIGRLEKAIERKRLRHIEQARTAQRNGQLRRSREHLLHALALRPDQPPAIKELKAVEARIVYAAIPAVPEIETTPQSEVDVYTQGRRESDVLRSKSGSGMAGAGSVGSNETDLLRHANQLLAQGSYEAALQELLNLRESKRVGREIDVEIAKIRRVLAARHFARGVAAFRAERYEEAVSEFELTLRHEPDHHKARFYHSSAENLSNR